MYMDGGSVRQGTMRRMWGVALTHWLVVCQPALAKVAPLPPIRLPEICHDFAVPLRALSPRNVLTCHNGLDKHHQRVALLLATATDVRVGGLHMRVQAAQAHLR